MTASSYLALSLAPQVRSAVKLSVSGVLWLLIRAVLPQIIQIVLEVLATQTQDPDGPVAQKLAELPRMPMSLRLSEVQQAAPARDR